MQPSIIVDKWGIKTGSLLGYAVTKDDFYVSREFTYSRAGTTPGTLINASGDVVDAVLNTPRIDYRDGAPALLVEPSATNGILNSTDTTTSWTLGANLTSGAIDVIGVTGNNITVAVSGSNIGSAPGCHQRTSNNITLTSGSTYTISFLMKKTGAHTIGGFFANTSGTTSTAFGSAFDVSGSFSSGSLIQSSPITNRIRRVEQWGTDVYRCSETFTMTATNILTTFRLGPTVSVTNIDNPAVDSELGFAAPQLEQNAVPTTFIPTTTTALTRNADVCSLSNASELIGQTEGTIYAEIDFRNLVSGPRIITINDGTTNNRLMLFYTGTNLTFGVNSSGSTVATLAFNTTTAGIYKLAGAYKQNDFVFYVNGTQAGTDTSGNVPVTLSRIDIGTELGFNFLNNRIRAAKIFKERLNASDLANLTKL